MPPRRHLMSFPIYMALPLLAAGLYAYGSLYFKKAFEHDISVIHTFVVTSWAMAIVFVPLVFLDPLPAQPRWVVRPILCALLFFGGHWFTFAAIRRGDMSIVVPAMGTKAFFVALTAAFFFGKSIHPGMWIASILVAVGISILNQSDQTRTQGISIPVILTLFSSMCFGSCDAAIQAWAPEYGARGFMGTMFLIIALFSSVFLRWADQPLKQADRDGMRALVVGASIIALQGTLVALSVVAFANATGVNVVYSSRGLWSVLLVWWLGHRFQTQEPRHDRRLLATRFLGATIMMAAVALALWAS